MTESTLLWCRSCRRHAKLIRGAWRAFGPETQRLGKQRGVCTGCETGDGRSLADDITPAPPSR